MTYSVVEVGPEETYTLRRAVLRDGTLSGVVEFEGDRDGDTFHLAALFDGRIVAVSTWLRREAPQRPGVAAFQLRGMATEPDCRSTGLGAALLDAGTERCRAFGADLVWARARIPALGFYERHGFLPSGDPYVDPTLGIPHRDIVLELH